MEKKDLDWESIGFSCMPMDKRYVASYKDGAWDEGGMVSDPNVVIDEYAGILQYCQEIFEGLKTYTTEDGNIITPCPNLNAGRMMDSVRRLEVPPFPKERFLEAMDQVVKANVAWVPPFGSRATPYLRLYMLAIDPAIGIKPSQKYQFRLFRTPVGPYFRGGAKPLTFCVSDFDRAAPNDTGHIRVGLNYTTNLHTSATAHAAGYDEDVLLDPDIRAYIGETDRANFLFVTKNGEVVTPKSDSTLPSITGRSPVCVAEYYLGPKVTQRPVKFFKLDEFVECGLYGTAAVISPVGRIVGHGKEIRFPSGMDAMGPVTKKLYDTLTDIQVGIIEAPEGWIRKIV